MPKSCIICRAVASPDVVLQYCAQCQSAKYCSLACQRIDWKKQHRQICKFLNVGHGDIQVRSKIHTDRQSDAKETIEKSEHSLDEGKKLFFKLFQESTFKGSRAAARKMKQFAKRQSEKNREILLFHSLRFLIRSDSEMLSWPSSPLLVLLHSVDPNVLLGDSEQWNTPLHSLGDLADPFDYSTHVNQLILAKQLIERGADVNALSFPEGRSPLHNACRGENVTNLDFVELLLQAGSDPNAVDIKSVIPLKCTVPNAPGAAKFLLNWPTTNASMTFRTDRTGHSFLDWVRMAVQHFSDEVARPDNTEKVQHQFLLQQWREIEKMLEERGPADTGITALL
jgi:hypothetical protein